MSFFSRKKQTQANHAPPAVVTQSPSQALAQTKDNFEKQQALAQQQQQQQQAQAQAQAQAQLQQPREKEANLNLYVLLRCIVSSVAIVDRLKIFSMDN